MSGNRIGVLARGREGLRRPTRSPPLKATGATLLGQEVKRPELEYFQARGSRGAAPEQKQQHIA